jgi:hypothetical protein
MVLLAYKNTFSSYLSDEQLQCADWVIRSLKNAYSKKPDGEWYKIHDTLLSGWRLTTFVNTVLNWVYTQECIADDGVVTTHNGDDVLAAVSTLNQVTQMQYRAKKINVRYQQHKCSLASTAEFLRVDHKTGNGAQYLSRAVSTFVHGPTESIVPNDALSLLMAIRTRGDELRSRNAQKDVVDLFEHEILRYSSEQFGLTEKEMQDVMATHTLNGGISKELDISRLRCRIVKIQDAERTVTDKVLRDKARDLPGVHAYVNTIMRKLKTYSHYKRIKEAAENAIFANSYSFRFGVMVEQSTPDDTSSVEMSQMGMYRHERLGNKGLLAKSFKIPISDILEDDTNIIDLIKYTRDPMKCLDLWT